MTGELCSLNQKKRDGTQRLRIPSLKSCSDKASRAVLVTPETRVDAVQDRLQTLRERTRVGVVVPALKILQSVCIYRL